MSPVDGFIIILLLIVITIVILSSNFQEGKEKLLLYRNFKAYWGIPCMNLDYA